MPDDLFGDPQPRRKKTARRTLETDLRTVSRRIQASPSSRTSTALPPSWKPDPARA
jgi:hypothetical protein